jgi:hypothetical protein
MCIGGVLVALDADIDRCADIFAVEGVDLAFQQVVTFPEGRVTFRSLGVVVEMAVMAFGEHGDGVDMGAFERAGELARVELGADIGHGGAGMEIEMDLALA